MDKAITDYIKLVSVALAGDALEPQHLTLDEAVSYTVDKAANKKCSLPKHSDKPKKFFRTPNKHVIRAILMIIEEASTKGSEWQTVIKAFKSEEQKSYDFDIYLRDKLDSSLTANGKSAKAREAFVPIILSFLNRVVQWDLNRVSFKLKLLDYANFFMLLHEFVPDHSKPIRELYSKIEEARQADINEAAAKKKAKEAAAPPPIPEEAGEIVYEKVDASGDDDDDY